jgi:tRNA 2-selenouridine synthase
MCPAQTVPMADAEDVLRTDPARRIDLRSPAEHAADHLPGAVNVPLFDDEERALIGTLYARRSREEAFREGRARTRAKIVALTRTLSGLCGWRIPEEDLVQRVEQMTAEGIERLERDLMPARVPARPDSVVLYCWRGGLRSRSMVAFLGALGIDAAIGLEGGYRAYRRAVLAQLERWEPPPSFVLRGLTGVGKTLVLSAVAEIRPDWVLDLEGLAGHRSSILGMVGRVPASQRLFESRLAARIRRGFGRVLLVEGESRKVGDLVLPPGLWRAVDGGCALELTAPRERRVRVLLDDYLASEQSREELAERLPFVEARLGAKWSGELVTRLRRGEEAAVVEILLDRYYDPLYRHSERDKRYQARFDTSDPRRAADDVVRWIEGHALLDGQCAPQRSCRTVHGALS